jgi:hypothetical protein
MRILLFAVFALAACAQTPAADPIPTPQPTPMPAPHSQLGHQIHADMARLEGELRAPGVVVAGTGEIADLGNGLTVRPIAIIEDSRCPLNATCIWAGRLRLRALVSGRDTELTLGETHQTPNGALQFVIASPSPWAEWPSEELGPRPAYRFGFKRG